jgi:hypothetical protein
MNKREFRHKLLDILKAADVPQTMSRERFINCNWKKKNGEKYLFHNDIEKDACRFVIKKLKKYKKYNEYQSFMRD